MEKCTFIQCLLETQESVVYIVVFKIARFFADVVAQRKGLWLPVCSVSFL